MKLSKELEDQCLALAVPAKRPARPYSPVNLLVAYDWHPWKKNDLIGCHFGTRSRRKRADREAVAVAAAAEGMPRASGKRRVSVRIILGPRQRGGDPDAYWLSLMDALKHAGLLVDDNRFFVELGRVTFERAARKATAITLEDLP